MIRDMVGRILVEGIGLGCALVSGAVTARYLGPEQRGVFSTLVLFVTLVQPVSGLGFGEAQLVLVGRGRTTMAVATAATLPTLGAALCLGLTVLAASIWFQFHGTQASMLAVLMSAAVALIASILGSWFVHLSNGQNRQREGNRGVLIAYLCSTAALWVLLVPLGLGISGALVATGIGWSVANLWLVGVLWRAGVRFRPRFDAVYTRQALRFNVPAQAALLLTLATNRGDLLLVYNLSGAWAAGQYSIALSISSIATVVGMAASNGTFSHLAAKGRVDPAAIGHISRLGVFFASVLCVLIAASAPWLVPSFFGEAFRPAVGPLLVLLPGTVAYTSQYLIARSFVAAGDLRVMVNSFVLTALALLGFDFFLVPRWGALGAAWGWSAASVVGLLVSVRGAIRLLPELQAAELILPRMSESLAAVRALRPSAPAQGPC